MGKLARTKFHTCTEILIVLSAAVFTNHSRGELVYKNPTKKEINSPDEAQSSPSAIVVDQVFVEQDGEYIALTKPSEEAVQSGTIVEIRRILPGHSVVTGQAKITEIQGDYLLAKVQVSSSPESQLLFAHYPKIMVGDQAFPKKFAITRTIHVSPTKTISYHDLFRDPHAYPNTFELSRAGEDTLRVAAQAFQQSKLPRLIVEGHTDSDGATDVNQVESYQRALTIRQFLIEEMKFDPERVVAVGMGETEPVDNPYLPDHKRQARRIVMKVKPY